MTQITFSPGTQRYESYQSVYVTDGTDPDMAVNGSGTPVIYSYVPPADVDLFRLRVVLVDQGTADPLDFGSIGGGLTNGVLIQIQSNGILIPLVNLQNNLDMVTTFNFETTGATRGFLDDDDAAILDMLFPTPIKLLSSASDFVSFTIRDNLNGVEFLRSKVLVGAEL